jgi:hypothetical protein
MGFFRRQAERREVRRRAAELEPSVVAFQDEIKAAARAVRDEFDDLPGFPPTCERCDRVMLYERVQLGRAKWRWMWGCPKCGRHVYDAVLQEARANGR